MNRDTIIDEVRTNRETIAREHDYDLASIFQMLVEAEHESPRGHESPVPPKVDPVAAAAQRSSVFAAAEGASEARGRRPALKR